MEDECSERDDLKSGGEGVSERQYLIIAIWNFDSIGAKLDVIKEYVVDKPIVEKDSVKPVHISE